MPFLFVLISFIVAVLGEVENDPCDSVDSNLCGFKCCTESNGSIVSNLTILLDYGFGPQPEVGYLAMQAQESYIVSVGSATNASFSNAGMLIHRDVDNDRVLASIWTPTMCITFPVPETCLLGSRFCPGYRLSPWPKFEHEALLDDVKVARFSWRHHKNNNEELGKLWVLKDSCMPLSIQQAVGPNLHANDSSISAFGESIISVLGSHTSNLIQEALKSANFELDDIPPISDYNWLSAQFSNSSSARPDSNLFTLPARCDSSIPPPPSSPTRSFWRGLDSLRNLASRM